MGQLKIKGEFNFDNYSTPQAIDYGTCKRPLFHGTRKYSLEISEEARQIFNEACNKILAFARTLIRNKKIEYNIVVNTAKQCFAFEYGDFYLTLSFTRAIDYSYNVGGELGQNIYKVCQVIKSKNIELTDEIRNAIDIVSSEYEKYEKSEKVILVVNDINFNDLYNRNGSKLIDSLELNEDAKEEIVDLYTEEETSNCELDRDFMVKNIGDYKIHVVQEKDFRQGIKFFTKIDNVDEYIKNHNILCGNPKYDF